MRKMFNASLLVNVKMGARVWEMVLKKLCSKLALKFTFSYNKPQSAKYKHRSTHMPWTFWRWFISPLGFSAWCYRFPWNDNGNGMLKEKNELFRSWLFSAENWIFHLHVEYLWGTWYIQNSPKNVPVRNHTWISSSQTYIFGWMRKNIVYNGK